VLVLDAEPVFAAGAAAVLQRAGLEVRAAAADAVAALSLALPDDHDAGPDVAATRRAGEPDPDGGSGPGPVDRAAAGPPPVLLLDSALAGSPGLVALVRAARARWPGAAVVLVLRREQQEGLLALLGAGARALVHRRCPPEDLVTAVRSAAEGRTWVSGPLAGPLRAESLAERSGHRPATLSARELEVLRRLDTGATNAAIAHSLGISDNTVRNHVHAILAKLGATNRTDAVALAARRGIVEISG
jgi:DNA-binding NarL/FixJ family response regulator